MAKTNTITGIDVGTHSLKLLSVFKKSNSSDFEVLVQQEYPSLGVRKGVVTSIDQVSKNIYQAKEHAQNYSGQKIDSAYVNIGGSHIYASSSKGLIAVSRADEKISQEDVDRVLQAAQAFPLPSNKEILEVFPREFIIDGESGIKEPVGMKGVRLEVDILALCAFSPYLKNLENAVLGSGIQVNSIVPSLMTVPQAFLTPQQRELGVAVVDIGAGTTDLAVFEEGNLIHAAVFPIGSANITNDIAIGLRTDVETAERLKKKFGTCIFRGIHKKEKVERPGQDPFSFSQKMLVKIVEARICEIFDLVEKELKKISRQDLLPAGIVLSGGGSKMPKIVEFVKKELKLPCRIGMSQGFLGFEDDPSFATVCGLVLEGANIEFEEGGRSFPRFSKGISGRLRGMFRIFIP